MALRKLALLERAGASITVVAPKVLPDFEARAAAGKIELAAARVRAGGSRRCAAGHRRDLAPRGESLDRNLERSARDSGERGGRPRGLAFHRSGHHRPRSGAGGGRDRGHLAGAGAPLARTAGGGHPEENRRTGTVAAGAAARRARGDCATPMRGADISKQSSMARPRGASSQATSRARNALRSSSWAARRAARPAAGEVTLVSAGPGDPELLTLKALRALQDADVILHDRLVPAAVLDMARRDAARICVGKAAGDIGSTQKRSMNCSSSMRVRVSASSD